MKQLIGIMLVLAALLVAGCSAPSETIAQTDSHDDGDDQGHEAETSSQTTETQSTTPETTVDEVQEESTSSSDETTTSGPQTVVVELDAFSFGYSVKEIKVNEGDTVRIIMTNTGGSHDLDIDEFNVDGPVISGGQTATMEFVADKKGSFEYYCSVGSHRAAGMVGTLIVE